MSALPQHREPSQAVTESHSRDRQHRWDSRHPQPQPSQQGTEALQELLTPNQHSVLPAQTACECMARPVLKQLKTAPNSIHSGKSSSSNPWELPCFHQASNTMSASAIRNEDIKEAMGAQTKGPAMFPSKIAQNESAKQPSYTNSPLHVGISGSHYCKTSQD